MEATERFYTDFGLTVAYRIENEIGFRPALARGYCYVACKASKPGLRAIGLPTLILNARNDPFMPATALPTKAEVSPSVTLELPQAGGHVGFVSGRLPGNLDWLPRRVLRFFAHS